MVDEALGLKVRKAHNLLGNLLPMLRAVFSCDVTQVVAGAAKEATPETED